MRSRLKTLVAVACVTVAAPVAAQVTLYSGEGFHGPAFTADGTVDNLDNTGFNDRAQSAVVRQGAWQVCEDAYFEGRCVTLRPGDYGSLDRMGMSRKISSIRPLQEGAYNRYRGPYERSYEGGYYRQNYNETEQNAQAYQNGQIYQVPVTSVHAVVGPPEQRCWVERQQVVEDRSGPNIPGAIVGGVIGGVLGHQIGSGRGNDVATAGGAVAGAAIGANVNRGGTQTYDRDVQRCETVPTSSRPDYWDVTYDFRGVRHRVQLSGPPGPTLNVDENGNPVG